MKAIILDIDGTLLDSSAIDTKLYFATLEAVLGPLRLRPSPGDYEHVTDSGILAEVLADNGRAGDATREPAIRALFVEKLREHMAASGPFPPLPGALDFVARLQRARDTRVAIATGGWEESARLKLAGAGFRIDGIPLVASNGLPARTAVMRAALRALGPGIRTVTYYGDGEWDRRACRELGWTFVAVGPALDGLRSFAGVEV